MLMLLSSIISSELGRSSPISDFTFPVCLSWAWAWLTCDLCFGKCQEIWLGFRATQDHSIQGKLSHPAQGWDIICLHFCENKRDLIETSWEQARPRENKRDLTETSLIKVNPCLDSISSIFYSKCPNCPKPNTATPSKYNHLLHILWDCVTFVDFLHTVNCITFSDITYSKLRYFLVT